MTNDDLPDLLSLLRRHPKGLDTRAIREGLSLASEADRGRQLTAFLVALENRGVLNSRRRSNKSKVWRLTRADIGSDIGVGWGFAPGSYR